MFQYNVMLLHLQIDFKVSLRANKFKYLNFINNVETEDVQVNFLLSSNNAKLPYEIYLLF